MGKWQDKWKASGFDSLGDFVMVGAALFLPVLAVGLFTIAFARASTPDLMSWWVAVPVGIGLGGLVLACQIITSGSDLMDVIVCSLVGIVLSLMLLPVGARAKANRFNNRLRQEHKSVVPVKVRTPQPLPKPKQN